MRTFGGIVFRVVKPGDVRDESLDASAVMQDFRTEYLCEDSDPPRWTLNRNVAHRFPNHADAVARGEKIGNCHVTVARDPNAPDDESLELASSRPAIPPAGVALHGVGAGKSFAPKVSRPAKARAAKKIARPRDAVPTTNRLDALRASHARGVERETREPFWYQKGDME